MDFTDLSTLLDRGGIVMIPLLGLSVLGLALILERAVFWLTTHRPSRRRWLADLHAAFREGRREVASGLAGSDTSVYGAVARALLTNGATEAVAVEAVERERPRLDRFMVILSTIITAAPLLGILGTVLGIIQSFEILGTEQRLTDPTAVVGGIAAALLTTATGLVVALLTLFPFMLYRSQADRALGRLESLVAAAQQGVATGPAAAESPRAVTVPRPARPAPKAGVG